MATVKVVRNVGRLERYTIFEGRRHVVHPFETKPLPAQVADKMVEDNHPHVVIENESGLNAIDRDDTEATPEVWLFNATGNPDAPQTVLLPRLDSVSRRMVKGPVGNPYLQPIPIKMQMPPSEIPITVRGEETTRRVPGRRIELWPYTRKAFKAPVAAWLRQRDAGFEMPGAVCLSRPPGPFEPDESWELLDLQIYASIIDSTIPLGKTEADIASESSDAEQMLELVGQAKEALMTRLFFRLADPAYKLPLKDEYETMHRTAVRGIDKKIARAEKTAKFVERTRLEEQARIQATEPA